MKSYDITELHRCYISIYDDDHRWGDGPLTIEIPYEWGLAGSEGAWFVLKPKAGTDEKYVAEARTCLRRNRDVVSLRTEREEKWTQCPRCKGFHGPTGWCG